METMANFFLKDMLEKEAAQRAAESIIATTTPRGTLLEIARQEGYRLFHIPGNVGGRRGAVGSGSPFCGGIGH